MSLSHKYSRRGQEYPRATTRLLTWNETSTGVLRPPRSLSSSSTVPELACQWPRLKLPLPRSRPKHAGSSAWLLSPDVPDAMAGNVYREEGLKVKRSGKW